MSKVVVERVARWRPIGVSATRRNVALIEATREVVLAARPRDVRDLGVLRPCFDLLRWAQTSGLGSPPDSLNVEVIERYLAEVLGDAPYGTVAATRSRLRVCLPGGPGFRPPAAQTGWAPFPAQAVVVKARRRAEPVDEQRVAALALVELWAPQWKNQDAWVAIADHVRQVVVHAAHRRRRQPGRG